MSSPFFPVLKRLHAPPSSNLPSSTTCFRSAFQSLLRVSSCVTLCIASLHRPLSSWGTLLLFFSLLSPLFMYFFTRNKELLMSRAWNHCSYLCCLSDAMSCNSTLFKGCTPHATGNNSLPKMSFDVDFFWSLLGTFVVPMNCLWLWIETIGSKVWEECGYISWYKLGQSWVWNKMSVTLLSKTTSVNSLQSYRIQLFWILFERILVLKLSAHMS